MNRTELIEHIHAQTGLSKKQAQAALKAALTAIEYALADGKEVQLTGFGTFVTARRAARKGTRPGSGEPIQIPAKTVVRFRPGKYLREAVS